MSDQPPQQPRRIPRGPPQLPPEEPAVPLTVQQARTRHTFVMREIDKIRKLLGEGKSSEEIQEVVPEFAKQFPKLFEKLTSGETYNENSLRTLLTMLDRMGTGQLSQDQASQIVGQRMVDTYIKPKLQGSGGSGAGAGGGGSEAE